MSPTPPNSYARAGVDVDAGARFVERIKRLVARAQSPRVLHGIGGFAGLFALDYGGGNLFRRNYKNPVLVAATDGVGTKIKIASLLGKHDTIGIDLVAMSVNDLICCGAEPLFFLDYFVTGRLDVDLGFEVMKGIAEGCRRAGCDLLGGETAEHPGDFSDGEYDLGGFAVGVVERSRVIDGTRIGEGDELIGIPSSGLHSNGYSLARVALLPQKSTKAQRSALARSPATLTRTLGEELLAPTTIYATAVATILRPYQKKRVVHGLAHITGGGLIENAPRVFGEDRRGLGLLIDPSSWQPPAIFQLLAATGIPPPDLFRTFNMGIGMVAVVPPYFRPAAIRRLKRLGYDARVIGRVHRSPDPITIPGIHEEER